MEQMMATMRAGHEETMANHEMMITKMNAWIEGTERDAVAEHREVPKEEAAVETFGALKKRYGDRYLATGSRRNGSREMVSPGISWLSPAE
jgi:hypothetical protein